MLFSWRFRRFRAAKALLVHDVRVAVVHPRPKHRVGALQYRAKGHLRARGEVPHGADVARDVLLGRSSSPSSLKNTQKTP